MKRYSIVSSSTRRKSAATSTGYNKNEDNIHKDEPATLELERLEQEITLSLQEIDKNLSRSNAIINDKIFPVLKNYGKASSQVWQNVNFWKYFMEQSANVELHGYEEPGNRSTDADPMRQTGILLDEDQVQGDSEHPGAVGGVSGSAGRSTAAGAIRDEADTLDTAATTAAGTKFKRPFGRAFQRVEDTPTWSAEKPQNPQIQASTPQYKRGKTGYTSSAARFDSSDLVKLQPPTTTANLVESPPKITHTIRKSLDNYHKVSISPRKRSPTRDRDENRRSSLIQNLIDSSPTLPEPPILLSEVASRDLEAFSLSPVRVTEGELKRASAVGSDLRPSESDLKRASLQRFPLTPKYRSSNPGSRRESLRRSVLPVKQQVPSSSEEIDPPPELESGAAQKGKPVDGSKVKPTEANDDEDNVFLDTSAKGDGDVNSATSTVYHSIMKHASREISHSHSATYSLFQEVHESSKRNDAEGEAEASTGANASPSVANDIFGDIIPPEDVTTGSTGELGSFLSERFNKFTKSG